MNLENFAEYLKYPSRLYQLPYEELKSLTLQYPYCGNFHVLLLIKSKLEGHPDLEKNLAKAATYSVDRRFLRQLMQEGQLLRPESQFTIGEDEILELKDLFTVEGELEKIPVELGQQAEEPAMAFPFSFETFDSEIGSPEDEALLPRQAHDEDELLDMNPLPDSSAGPFTVPEEPLPEELAIVPEDVKDEPQAGIPDAGAEPGVYLLPAELVSHVSSALHLTQLWPFSAPAAPVAEPPAPDASAPPSPQVTVPVFFEVPPALAYNFVAIQRALEHWWEKQEQAPTLEWDVPVSRPAAAAPAPSPQPAIRIQVAPTPKNKFKSYHRGYPKPLVKTDLVPEPVQEIFPEPPTAREIARESVREDLEIASETLAGLLVQQQQYDRAIKMYEHLSLLIPEKNTYFAAKIDAIKNL